MAITFHIDDISNPKAKAFLEYIKTLEFVIIDRTESQEFTLTDEHLQILNQRRTNRMEGTTKTSSWEEVKEFSKSRKSK